MKIEKFSTGRSVPKGAQYLTTLESRAGEWHYFLVPEEKVVTPPKPKPKPTPPPEPPTPTTAPKYTDVVLAVLKKPSNRWSLRTGMKLPDIARKCDLTTRKLTPVLKYLVSTGYLVEAKNNSGFTVYRKK